MNECFNGFLIDTIAIAVAFFGPAIALWRSVAGVTESLKIPRGSSIGVHGRQSSGLPVVAALPD